MVRGYHGEPYGAQHGPHKGPTWETIWGPYIDNSEGFDSLCFNGGSWACFPFLLQLWGLMGLVPRCRGQHRPDSPHLLHMHLLFCSCFNRCLTTNSIAVLTLLCLWRDNDTNISSSMTQCQIMAGGRTNSFSSVRQVACSRRVDCLQRGLPQCLKLSQLILLA